MKTTQSAVTVESVVRPRVSHKELKKLFDEYLSTLRDDDRDELYCSSRSFAEVGVRPFLKWLRKRIAV
jgi:hypothetical protein